MPCLAGAQSLLRARQKQVELVASGRLTSVVPLALGQQFTGSRASPGPRRIAGPKALWERHDLGPTRRTRLLYRGAQAPPGAFSEESATVSQQGRDGQTLFCGLRSCGAQPTGTATRPTTPQLVMVTSNSRLAQTPFGGSRQ